MESGTVKTKTIFISAGEKTHVFRSNEEVPAFLRRKFDRITSSGQSATLLIADKNGRDELMRAVAGQSNALRLNRTPRLARAPKYVRWIEIAVVGSIGLAVWATFLFK